MTLECVQKRADEEYPDANIEILVSEIVNTEEGTNVTNHICRRNLGKWVEAD